MELFWIIPIGVLGGLAVGLAGGILLKIKKNIKDWNDR